MNDHDVGGGADHVPLQFAGVRQGATHELNASELPDRGSLDDIVPIAGDELQTAQIAPSQAVQNLCPERLGLAGAEIATLTMRRAARVFTCAAWIQRYGRLPSI